MSQMLKAYPASDVTIKLGIHFLDEMEKIKGETLSEQMGLALVDIKIDAYAQLLAYVALREVVDEITGGYCLFLAPRGDIYTDARNLLRSYLTEKTNG